ncbi:MAG: hypothetical protein H7A23_22235 [Leptospiraceae bacterium]|nr:hypothetical protein [Leptospiraceae bacterium]MCP5497281.1 hypothetical protein [Leptospiraceae bacterium]
MTNKNFSVEKIVSFGVETFSKNLPISLFWFFLSNFIYYVPIFLSKFLFGTSEPDTIFRLLQTSLFTLVLQIAASTMVSIGVTRIALNLHDKLQTSIMDFFQDIGLFMEYLIASTLYLLIIVSGVVLLFIPIGFIAYRSNLFPVLSNLTTDSMQFLYQILYQFTILGFIFLLSLLPAIYFSIRLQFFGYFIIDQRLSPIESLKASFNITKGILSQLLVVDSILFAMNFLGILFCFVGIIVSYPITVYCMAYLYRQLTQKEDQKLISSSENRMDFS